MRVYQATYSKNGRQKSAKKWTVEFRDHNGITRRLTLFSDKTASREAGKKLERLADLRRMKQPPGRELSGFLESLPENRREKLAAWGLLEPESVAASKTLLVHLDDWRSALAAKGNTEQHVAHQYSRAKDVFTKAGFKALSEVNATGVQKVLNVMREDGVALRTINYRLGAAKQFCRWAVRERRASENPLAQLEPLNAAMDVRRERRALSSSDCVTLLRKVEQSHKRACMSGPERALFYRLALGTGLRANECRSLTVADFDLDSPAVRVRASTAKNRKEVWQPLPEQLVAPLKAHLKNRLPVAKAFDVGSANALSKAFKSDLEDAKLARHDESGRIADFHCLRHTYITNMANSGVHPNVAKVLARHSTITLTMDRYSHVRLEDERKAVAMLPSMETPAEVKATGTDGAVAGDGKSLASGLAFSGGQQWNSDDKQDAKLEKPEPKNSHADQPQTRKDSTKSAPEAGSEADDDWRWRWDSNPHVTDLQSVA